MSSQAESLPQIRKAIFIVDKNRRYSFDVNQDITIHKLKKMIVSAANLQKVGLRIFHDGTEYTEQDYESLDVLFPNLKRVEFTLSISYDNVDALDQLIKIKLNTKYCPKHNAKYPYFYCYNCQQSICSTCVLSGEHKGHDIKEKYDYLQNSRFLIEQLFRDLKLNLAGLSEETIDDLRMKINVKFFPELVKIVQQIEGKLVSLIDEFVNKKQDNVKRIKNNLEVLKDHCAEGLDKLKDEIEIEDLMLDEEIFLTFDRKFKGISTEKEKFKHDVEKFQQYTKEFSFIVITVEKIYKDIKSFLETYLNNNIYDEITKKIEDSIVAPVEKEEIFYKLLSDIKKNPLRRSYKKTKPFPPIAEIAQEENHSSYKKKPNEDDVEMRDVPKQKPHEIVKNSPVPIHQYKKETLFICQPVLGTLFMTMYSLKDEKVCSKKVNTGSLLSITQFPKDSAWYNLNNALYISGGSLDHTDLKQFYKYDPVNNTLIRLPEMPEGRSNHSICADEEGNIYMVGGSGKSVLKYDTVGMVWSKLGCTLVKERYHPITIVKNNTIYAFYGLDSEGKFVSGIEKAGIKSKGLFTLFNENDGIKLVYGGIVPVPDNEIIIFGGKNEGGVPLQTGLRFSFTNENIEFTQYTLFEGAFFHQSVIPQLNKNAFGFFSFEDEMPFIKINFT